MERGGWLVGARRLPLENGLELRLLSAMEVMQARREAAGLADEARERAVCSNACLVAKALERKGRPVYESGEAALKALTVEEITALARRWTEFNRRENPGLTADERQVETLKKAWSTRRRSACSGVCSELLERFLRSRGPGR